MSRLIPVLLLTLLCVLSINSSFAKNGFDEAYSKPIEEKNWGNIATGIVGTSDYKKSYALVIGISGYDDQSFNDLPTSNDPIKIKDYLLDEAGFDYVHLLTEEKVTKARLSELMVDVFPSLLEKNDRFVFYWSGHGVTRNRKTKPDKGYLALKDSSANKYGGMTSMDDIRKWDDLVSEAKQTLYILDSCFGGLAGSLPKSNRRLDKIETLSKPSSELLAAGGPTEETIASEELGGSVFTHAILEGLRGKADSANNYPKDGVVTLNELKGFVETRVNELRRELGWNKSISPQRTYLRNGGGEFFFLTSIAKENKLRGDGLEPSGKFLHGFPVPKSNKDEESYSLNKTSPDLVKDSQRKLMKLGYDPGPTDGILGEKTKSALLRFQQDAGIRQNGELSIETVNALSKSITEITEKSNKIEIAFGDDCKEPGFFDFDKTPTTTYVTRRVRPYKGKDFPEGSLSRVKKSDGKFYVYTKWRNLQVRDYNYTTRLFDGSGNVVYNSPAGNFNSKEVGDRVNWFTGLAYEPKLRDKTGTWTYVVCESGKRQAVKKFEVLD